MGFDRQSAIPLRADRVNLLGDESENAEHLARNPMGYVPVLEVLELRGAGALPGGVPRHHRMGWRRLTRAQSLLLRAMPTNERASASWPSSSTRARSRWLISAWLKRTRRTAKRKSAGQQLWLHKGLEAYEKHVSATAGLFSVGDSPTLADIYLVPQCYSALRNEVPLDAFPTISRIWEAALRTESCKLSHPDRFAPPRSASPPLPIGL